MVKTFKYSWILSQILLSLLLVNASSAIFAHGENIAGPHQGYIRMPGAFHTEVVPNGEKHFKIYLLDFQFAEPTTEDSKVKVNFTVIPSLPKDVACTAEIEYFACHLDSNSKLERGVLAIRPTRLGIAGTEASYMLPLNFVNFLGH